MVSPLFIGVYLTIFYFHRSSMIFNYLRKLLVNGDFIPYWFCVNDSILNPALLTCSTSDFSSRFSSATVRILSLCVVLTSHWFSPNNGFKTGVILATQPEQLILVLNCFVFIVLWFNAYCYTNFGFLYSVFVTLLPPGFVTFTVIF